MYMLQYENKEYMQKLKKSKNMGFIMPCEKVSLKFQTLTVQ